MSTRDRYDVIIIGAGHNGLVTAAYLARAGLSVLVLEARPQVGGACVTEELYPGFRFSSAAYLCSLLQEKVIRDLNLPAFGYHVFPKNPAYFSPFPDGRHLFFWQDQHQTVQEIARFSRRDALAFPAFEEELDRLAVFVQGLLLRTPPDFVPKNLDDLGKWLWLLKRVRALPAADLKNLIRIMTQSVGDYLNARFESEELKVSLATDGVIGTNGGPYTPGTAYVLLHHCMGGVDGRRGLWGFARGGMGSITQAMAGSARASGAQILTGTPAARILVEGSRAAGVVSCAGDEWRARCVVSAVDPKRTFLKLLDGAHLPPEFLTEIRDLKMEGSSFKVNLAVDQLPDFTHYPGGEAGPQHRGTIHICPSLDYMEKAWDEAKFGSPSTSPLIEMTIPTVYDSTLAPPGKHILSIFVQYAPFRLREGEWRERGSLFADRVIDILSDYAPNLKQSILFRHFLSPFDLEEQFGLTGGNIFHGELSLDQLFFMRPAPGWAKYRTPLRGLYLCGSGTHPGGGVMGAPGHNAAREIVRDWKSWRNPLS